YRHTPAMNNGVEVGDGNDDSWERFEYHRDQLVKLGRFGHINYAFQHILARTDEARHLFRSIDQGVCPALLYGESAYPNAPAPLQIKIWCELPAVPEWDRFLRSRDVADYRSRFMKSSPHPARAPID